MSQLSFFRFSTPRGNQPNARGPNGDQRSVAHIGPPESHLAKPNGEIESKETAPQFPYTPKGLQLHVPKLSGQFLDVSRFK